MIIYYNPECSKCNEALDLLHARHCEVEIRNYLELPPTEEELRNLIARLGCKAEELVRKTEPLYLEKFQDHSYSDEEWIGILRQYPVLMQRPIVIDGKKAIIGRPPVRVLELI